jgi:hypothetical protein
VEINAINDWGWAVGSFHNEDHAQGFATNGLDQWHIYNVEGMTNTRWMTITKSWIVAGSVVDSNGVHHGIVWDAAADVRWLVDVPGAQLTEITGANDAGVLVGRYIDGQGVHRGFIARPLEPLVSVR